MSIAGINSYSHRRQRMSVVVHNQSKGKDSFTLYVRGSDKGVGEILHMNQEERNNFKRLMVNIKNKGLKMLVFAKKELDLTTAKRYIKTFKLIRKSRKDQAQNFEKLAIEIEKTLDFVGVVAYKDNIMPGAAPLINSLTNSGVNISILTGDKFFNSFIAAKTLEIIDFDFRDTSKYYSLRFENIFSAENEIYRILETLYERLREKNVANLENINQHSEMSKRLIEEAKQGISDRNSSRSRRLTKLKTSILDSHTKNMFKTAN